jgi:hypothetical protein
MKLLPLRLALASALALLLAAAPRAAAAVANGRPAPDFALTDIDGQAHHLSDYKGRVVVLEWNNPDCPIVHKHYDSGNIPSLQRTATADGVVWLLINSGAPGKEGADYTAAEIKSWLRERGSVPTAYLRDPTGAVGHLYDAQTTPHLFVITADGTLVYHGAIDSIPSTNPADIPRARNYVREALAAVKAGQPVAPGSSRAYGCTVKY